MSSPLQLARERKGCDAFSLHAEEALSLRAENSRGVAPQHSRLPAVCRSLLPVPDQPPTPRRAAAVVWRSIVAVAQLTCCRSATMRLGSPPARHRREQKTARMLAWRGVAAAPGIYVPRECCAGEPGPLLNSQCHARRRGGSNKLCYKGISTADHRITRPCMWTRRTRSRP